MAIVFIDPGHGGSDSGASNLGILEKELNLKVGLYLKAYLEKSGIQVSMSRTADKYVGLPTRADQANGAKANYFVAIHHNAGGGTGHEVIHSVVKGKGLELAKKVSAEFVKIGQPAHGSKAYYSKANSAGKDYFAVIRETNMPAIITEFAFIDSADRSKIDSDGELKAEAEAIGRAILSQLGIKEAVPVVDETVKHLQTFLNSIGYVGENGKVLTVDNINGKNTTFALKAFQNHVGIQATGKYDSATKTAIRKVYNCASFLK